MDPFRRVLRLQSFLCYPQVPAPQDSSTALQLLVRKMADFSNIRDILNSVME